MANLLSQHARRQTLNDGDGYPYECSWWTCDETAIIVKWAIVGAIVLLLLLYILGGFYHARRRMRRGQAPLRYHRWLVSRHQRERFSPPGPPQNSAAYYRPTYASGGYGQPQSYQMHDYGHAAPPPAYNEGDHVPKYTPPSKVNPDQMYAPPPGSPPPRDAAAGSSSLAAPGPSQPLRTASPFRNNK